MFPVKLCYFIVFFTSTHSDILFMLYPKFINVGVTKNLAINCSVTDNFVSGIGNISRIVLSRLSNDEQFDPILAMPFNSPNGSSITEHMDTSKWTVIQGATYVSLIIPNPTERDATEYACDVYGLTQHNSQRAKCKVHLHELNTTSTVQERQFFTKGVCSYSSYEEMVEFLLHHRSSIDKDDNLDLQNYECNLQMKAHKAIRLTFEPNELSTELPTNVLQVGCNFKSQCSTDLFRFVSIVISHSTRTENPQFENLLIIKSFDGRVKKISFDHLRSNFSLTNNGDAQVNITWILPSINKIGLYRCDINGIDVWGRPHTLSATSLLRASKHVIDTLNEFNANVVSLMGTISAMKADIYKVENENNKFDKRSLDNSENISKIISNFSQFQIDFQNHFNELYKQQIDSHTRLENQINDTKSLISADVKGLTENAMELESALKFKANSDIVRKLEEKFHNSTSFTEKTFLNVQKVNDNLTQAVDELKSGNTHQVEKLQKSINELTMNSSNKTEQLNKIINDIKRSNESCVVSHKTLTETLSKNSHSLQLSLDRLQDYIKSNASKLIDLQGQFQQHAEKFHSLIKRTVHPKLLLRDELHKLFTPISGERYWLTRSNYSNFMVADAQSLCERFGGYLAEVDSEAEYEKLLNFIRIQKIVDYVIVGGTDVITENTWLNRYSLTNVSVFHWGEGEPNNKNDEDCQCFARIKNEWKMNDCRCDFSNEAKGGFICEIPS